MKLKLNLKKLTIKNYPDVIVTVNGVAHGFRGWEDAAKFHRNEAKKATKGEDGYDGCISVISVPVTKKETNYLMGK